MLDRTDFESWQQRIRLYCLGKNNGENIMKSITEGPFQMGTFIQTPAEDAEDTRVHFNIAIIITGRQRHLGQCEDDSGRTSSNARKQSYSSRCQSCLFWMFRDRYNVNNQGSPFQEGHGKESVVAGDVGAFLRISDTQRKMLLMNALKNGAVLDEEQLLYLAGDSS
ncbi:hypothetical protein Tco_0567005 [Tanacetum coccineum]